ncbi:NAD(P)/FAD-dependent oxidoreductase [Flavobacterium sp.]|uniref:NAD(P)/FAD-dependent oxidoreductase n=1 Tax=Flavobacterium sp. TaxID=239 RepID=UPI002489D5B1|nr:NAD(P)/FAD-dependent oxidoreductase [Flavobacterium sp.]MDI1317372.1 NAD(P)/FAD-dependent oxidoreductase [Flavobacterium sp.]
MKKIVVIGGGFAGLNLAKKLTNNKHYDVTVVDINNYHFFPPLLYQVSTAFIEASNISYPYRKLFQKRKNIRFYMGSLLKVNPDLKTIELDTGELNYDYLVLAMGTETNFFGNQNIIDNALPMKTIDDALKIRNHILLCMERAVRAKSLSEKVRLANIVIAGGGPTGVEMGGMLAEMARNIGKKDYPESASNVGNIYLIDNGDTLLGPMSTKAQTEAYNVLNKLGVKIQLNTMVKDYVDGEVLLSSGKKITTATVIWATGVIGKEVVGLPAETITRGRRILVDEINRVTGFDAIFSIGDQCFQTSDKNYPTGHPQLAQVALQQGTLLAANFNRIAENNATVPFSYSDKGSMAIISKYRAVVDLPKVFFSGFFAWLVWLFIHILPLVGFGNKLKLAFNWTWSFFTNDPTLRLIIRRGKND